MCRSFVAEPYTWMRHNFVKVILRVGLLDPQLAGFTSKLQVCSPLGRGHLPGMAMLGPINQLKEVPTLVGI